MDVKRSQPQHLEERLVRKPNAIALVPPKRLKTETANAQRQSKNRQPGDDQRAALAGVAGGYWLVNTTYSHWNSSSFWARRTTGDNWWPRPSTNHTA